MEHGRLPPRLCYSIGQELFLLTASQYSTCVTEGNEGNRTSCQSEALRKRQFSMRTLIVAGWGNLRGRRVALI